MTAEQWSALGSVGALFVLSIAAFAAFVQLRHMRSNNQLRALLAIQQDFREERLQRAFAFVQCDLTAALENPAYRAELARRGFVDARQHPEMEVCNWFNEAGMLVKSGFIDEELFFTSFARLVAYSWSLLSPAIAVLRRERGRDQYDAFEYLAARGAIWMRRNQGRGMFPPGVDRLRVDDPWLESDRRAGAAEPLVT